MESPLRIGEVARRTGLTVRTLRHYDALGLLVPAGRSDGDYRLYDEADLRRLLAIQHLKSLGLTLDEVARALDDPSFDAADALRRHAALVEERIAAERELLRQLRRLDDVAAVGWADVVAAIRLSELLRHPDAVVRLRATLDAPGAAPVETLVDSLLGDPSAAVREVVTWALAQRGSDAAPALVARLRDADPGVRLQVAHALSKLGDAAAVGPLAALLFDDEPAVAAKAAFALGQVGAAAFALGQVGGDDAMGRLVDAVGVAHPVVRDAVSDALARFGARAAAPVEELLADPHASVREHAAEALGLLGAPEAASVLAGALGDPDAGVRYAALLALGQLGTDEAGRALEGALASPDERTRLVAQRLVSDRRAAGRPGR